MESGYYPAGAEFDPEAPYNKVDTVKEKKVVYTVFTVAKEFIIETDENCTRTDCEKLLKKEFSDTINLLESLPGMEVECYLIEDIYTHD